MSTTRPARVRRPDGVIARMQARLFEGPNAWGNYDVTVGRSGVIHHRLTMYPPGTNAAERRALTRARDWPVAGAVFSLLAIMIFGATLGPTLLTLGAIVMYTLGIAATRWSTRRLRRSVRVIDAVQVSDGRRTVSHGDLNTILAAVAELHTLDDVQVDQVEYEARWAEVYRSIAAAAS